MNGLATAVNNSCAQTVLLLHELCRTKRKSIREYCNPMEKICCMYNTYTTHK